MKVYKEGKIVHFALDTLSHRKAAMRLGRMITQDLNTLCGLIESEGRAPDQRPLAVTIDEYQAFGTEGFIDTLTRGRSSGLWVTLAHQSLGDLKAIGPQHRQQVADSTNIKLSLRVNEPETAESFSKALGTHKTVQTTKHVALEGEAPATLMGYQRISEEYIIHPSEVKNLADGRAVFKSPGRHGRLILPGLFPDIRNVALPVCRDGKNGPLKPRSSLKQGSGLII
jgi:type IV secretory pathway TraG/TraD family ATPase VirD4